MSTRTFGAAAAAICLAVGMAACTTQHTANAEKAPSACATSCAEKTECATEAKAAGCCKDGTKAAKASGCCSEAKK